MSDERAYIRCRRCMEEKGPPRLEVYVEGGCLYTACGHHSDQAPLFSLTLSPRQLATQGLTAPATVH